MFLLTRILLEALVATLLHLVPNEIDMPLALPLLRTRLLFPPNTVDRRPFYNQVVENIIIFPSMVSLLVRFLQPVVP